jgi:hypothetical protein
MNAVDPIFKVQLPATVTKEFFFSMAEIYAEQEAIRFLRWVGSDDCPYFEDVDGVYRRISEGQEVEGLTEKDLYKLYLQSKQ